MMKIERRPVPQNSKCEGCLHYDGNAMSKGGACEAGTQPYMCGDGAEPLYGYAPLSVMGPDQASDLAVPALLGTPGALNETGQLDPTIKMKQVCLGDEHLTIAQRIYGQAINMRKGFVAPSIGQTTLGSPDGHVLHPYEHAEPTAIGVARTMYKSHFRPREQCKFSLTDVLDFLKDNGFNVTQEDYDAVDKE